MGGEGEGSEIRPEEPEPKVVDANESDGDARPSDPGFDASDGDRDRGQAALSASREDAVYQCRIKPRWSPSCLHR